MNDTSEQLCMHDFEHVRDELIVRLVDVLYEGQQPPKDQSKYLALLSERDQSSVISGDSLVHLTFPSLEALEVAWRWGLNKRAGSGPTLEDGLRALTADVVTLCPIPLASWQFYARNALLEPAREHWIGVITEIESWLGAQAAGDFDVVPSMSLVAPSRPAESLVKIRSIRVPVAKILSNVEHLNGVETEIYFLQRPFLSWPQGRNPDGRRVLLGYATQGEKRIQFPPKPQAKRVYEKVDVRDLTTELLREMDKGGDLGVAGAAGTRRGRG